MIEGGAGPTVERVSSATSSTRSTSLTFEELYQAELAPMVRLARLLVGSTEVAEDLVADSFAKVLVKWKGVDRPGAYLRRTVINGCLGRRRRSWREQPFDSATSAAAAPTVVDELDRSDLSDALAALPDRQRAAIVLRFYLGMSERETADTLRCRPGTVGSLVNRGLAGLRIELDEELS